MTNWEKIKQIVDYLAVVELGYDGRRLAIIKPTGQSKTIADHQHILLDTLARLLTKDKEDTCVAVCYHKYKLIVANNFRKANYC